MVLVEVAEWRELVLPCEAIVKFWTPAIADRTPLADTLMLMQVLMENAVWPAYAPATDQLLSGILKKQAV